jgi:hypothetical protein
MSGVLAGQKRKYSTLSDPLAGQPTHQPGPLFEAPNVLCAACSLINFDAIFAREIRDWRGEFVKDLGLITPEWETRDCQLCRLWAAMRPIIAGKEDDQRYQHFQLYAYSSLRSFSDTDDGITRQARPRFTDSVFLGVIVKGSGKSGTHNKAPVWWRNTTRITGFIASVPTLSSSFIPSSKGYFVRSIKADTVDYQLLRYWIGYCERKHIRACSTHHASDQKIPHFRVIDCAAQPPVIIEAEDSTICRYLALSYVWGPPQKEETEKGRKEAKSKSELSLPAWNQLPRVIQDGITTTKELGHQYLWVDRYCVNQDPNSKEQKVQIRNMARVYEHASVCIIAAAGCDPSRGLPGVGEPCRIPQPCRCRIPQPYATVGTRTLVSTMPTLESEIKCTVWTTRAWTYQEVLFSTRRLFFTENQVHFECNTMYCSEAVQRPLDNLHRYKKEQLKSCVNKPIFASQLNYIWNVLAEYSSKRLTRPGDILNGISGVLEWYGRNPRSLYHICGIPFSAESDATDSRPEVFALNLFWQHDETKKPSPRRPGLPSWSWCGWLGTLSRANRRSGRTAKEAEIWLWLMLEKLSIVGWVRLETIQNAIRSSHTGEQIEYISTQLALCHTIRVKARTMDIRLKHEPQARAGWLALLESPCDHCAATACTEFFLTRDIDEDDAFLKRLERERFTGLILGHTDRVDGYLAEPYCPRVLVVDWKDERQTIAERIGFFCIRSTLVYVGHTCGRNFDPRTIPTLEREVILQ